MLPMASTLSAHHLAKAYGGRPVVKDVSLQVSAGEIVGLLGPNGAGKTTCFYMIVGLVEADAGDIRLDDESLMAMPMHRRARAGIGYLPQEASVFRQLSVRDNLLAILETRPELTRKMRHSLAESLLEEFNVGHLAESLGQALSWRRTSASGNRSCARHRAHCDSSSTNPLLGLILSRSPTSKTSSRISKRGTLAC
jgi:lipopolysaccharide export system ATP-binding protein